MADNLPWHKKIAKARGNKWLTNVREGKRDALINPSIIRLMRLKRRADQREIAKTLDLSESTYGQIERGKRMVKKEIAEAIASALNAPVQKLFKSASRKKFVALIQKSLV